VSLKSRLQRELALAILFIAAAVVLTWPLARVIRTGVSDLGDPLLNVWIIDWVQHALVHQPLHLFDAPVFYPAKYPLAYSENMLGIAALMLPFRAAGLQPVTLFNVAMLLGFAGGAYGASVLARTAGSSVFAAVIAGLGYGFCQFFFDHLPHLQIVWGGWVPLILAGVINFWRVPTWRNAALAAAAFLGNALTNIYFMLFASVALAIALLFFLTAGERRSTRELARLVIAFAVAGAVLYPVLAPYKTVAKLYKMRRGSGEVIAGSATWIDWLTSTGRNAIYGRVEPPGDHGERRLFPGAVPILMTLAAIFLAPFPRKVASLPERRTPRWLRALLVLDIAIVVPLLAYLYAAAVHRQVNVTAGGVRLLTLEANATPVLLAAALFAIRCAIRVPLVLTRGEARTLRECVARSRFSAGLWAAALWILVGVAGAFGANGPLHMYLYEHVYVFQSLRAVGRWGVIAYVGLVPWSATGIDALIASRKRWTRIAIACAITLLMFADVATRLRWENAPIDPAPIYQWMAKQSVEGPFLELPMEGENSEYVYMLGSTVHHRMLVNGTSGFEPPLHMTLRDMTNAEEYNDVLQSILENNRVRYLIIHGDSIQKRDVLRSWLYWAITSGKLAFVRRFDHGVEGDYLLAVTKDFDGWKRFARAEDQDKLGRYLHHLPTYNESVFGALEKPAMMSTVFKTLEVSGWALSPKGIRAVEVELGSAKERYAATMVPRPDINARYPWYGNAPSGFRLVVPKRPKGMPRETDVQVFITDGAGQTLRLKDTLITWH
jgi:hypothetical protein